MMESVNFSLVAQGLFGLCIFLAIGWLLSENRKKINYFSALTGVGVQILCALITTRIEWVRAGFLKASEGINVLKTATMSGTSFVFGHLGGGELPFTLKDGSNAFVFAFQPLPMIMVISALSMLLFHWRILPAIVRGLSWGFRKTLGIGGALGVCAAAKVFLGQTDAPLLIRPYLNKLSRSELFTVMTAGMATTSASIMILYATILETTISDPISHILTASIISIPAAIVISRLIVPQEGATTEGNMVMPYHFSGSMEAVSQGAGDGMKLFLNIIAMLVVMLALVALVNAILESLPFIGGQAITLQRIFGRIMAPVTWLMGISWQESFAAGKLLGTKTVLNEVMAFIDLTQLPKGDLSPRSNLIMMYALCGFANFSSIGIQIGGLGTMAPERRSEIISLGFKALIAGTIASCMSGTVIGLLRWGV
jgi:CNT family concentrative nucleoside transporter